MKLHLQSIFLFLLIAITNQFLVAQPTKNFFEKQLIVADINFDNIKDIIVVSQDTLNPKSIYKLEIYTAEIDGVRTKQLITTEKAIKPDFPDATSIDDRFWSGEMFDNVEVENGVLSIRFNLMRGYYIHNYKFQNNSFELISVKKLSGSPDYLEEIDFNLITGERKIKIQEGSKKPIIKKESIKLAQLPQLGEFVPFDTEELY